MITNQYKMSFSLLRDSNEKIFYLQMLKNIVIKL